MVFSCSQPLSAGSTASKASTEAYLKGDFRSPVDRNGVGQLLRQGEQHRYTVCNLGRLEQVNSSVFIIGSRALPRLL